jgi:hypothetical protein
VGRLVEPGEVRPPAPESSAVPTVPASPGPDPARAVARRESVSMVDSVTGAAVVLAAAAPLVLLVVVVRRRGARRPPPAP